MIDDDELRTPADAGVLGDDDIEDAKNVLTVCEWSMRVGTMLGGVPYPIVLAVVASIAGFSIAKYVSDPAKREEFIKKMEKAIRKEIAEVDKHLTDSPPQPETLQ